MTNIDFGVNNPIIIGFLTQPNFLDTLLSVQKDNDYLIDRIETNADWIDIPPSIILQSFKEFLEVKIGKFLEENVIENSLFVGIISDGFEMDLEYDKPMLLLSEAILEKIKQSPKHTILYDYWDNVAKKSIIDIPEEEVLSEDIPEDTYIVNCIASDGYMFWSSRDESNLSIIDSITTLEQAHEIGKSHCVENGMWYSIHKDNEELFDERTKNVDGEFVTNYLNDGKEIVIKDWNKFINLKLVGKPKINKAFKTGFENVVKYDVKLIHFLEQHNLKYSINDNENEIQPLSVEDELPENFLLYDRSGRMTKPITVNKLHLLTNFDLEEIDWNSEQPLSEFLDEAEVGDVWETDSVKIEKI
jgi:hypothetical protein